MADISAKEVERWQGEVLGLERTGTATEADWSALRAREPKLGGRRLSDLRQKARQAIEKAAAQAGQVDLRSEFEKAKRIYEEIAARMDRVYSVTFHGIPVCDADEEKEMGRRVQALNVAVAAMRTKSDANERLARLLNLMVPEADADQATTQLEQAVQDYLAPRGLTKTEVPPVEIVRLAGERIAWLELTLERKLRVAG